MVPALDATILNPPKPQTPRNQIVLLHGWGANAQDLLGLTPALNLTNCVVCCPNAPFPHPQVPEGRMWYDLEKADPEGLNHSRQLLLDWLQSLPTTTTVPLSRTILAGFSQGGAMTLDLGLRLPLAGLVVMSGYLHANLKPSRAVPPTLVMHGRLDPVVPIAAAQQLQSFLQDAQAPLTYAEFDMAHEISPEAVAQMVTFIAETLG
jgi:phospholipase/carboxylesterase